MEDFIRDKQLRYDRRSINKNRSQEHILTNWISGELALIFYEQDERVVFPESQFSQTLPESLRHIFNIDTAQSLMPESGQDFTSDIEFDAWCEAYRALGFPDLANLLESTRDIRPTHEKWNSGIEPTDAEESRIQAVCDEICSHEQEIVAARFEYTMKHRAELEAISPTFKEIFELYDRRAIGLED